MGRDRLLMSTCYTTQRLGARRAGRPVAMQDKAPSSTRPRSATQTTTSGVTFEDRGAVVPFVTTTKNKSPILVGWLAIARRGRRSIFVNRLLPFFPGSQQQQQSQLVSGALTLAGRALVTACRRCIYGSYDTALGDLILRMMTGGGT